VVCATSVNTFKNRLQRIWERDEFVFGPRLLSLNCSFMLCAMFMLRPRCLYTCVFFMLSS